MTSPFPGMDPYLEEPETWGDFHTTLYVEIKGELNALLPPGFVARIDRYVWIHEPDAKKRLLGKPDVFVSGAPGSSASTVAMISSAAPTQVLLPAQRREGGKYLKIVDGKSRRVVTVFEILSPSNKTPGLDREAYLLKRNEYLGTGVNLIELDFLRRGPRLPLGTGSAVSSPYYVLVSAAWDFPRAGVWPIGLRDSLPTIPIPLTQEAPVIALSLQKCFAQAFAKGRLEAEIDYTMPPDPPLEEPDASWARELVKARCSP